MKRILLLISFLVLFCPVLVLAESEVVTLEACVDGDTAKFKSQDGMVTTYRFLAVDTPETVHPTKGEEPFGKEASDFTCTTLTNAIEITLEFDEKADKTDNYGRGLAWVFTDGVFLQEQLVAKGYAEVAYLYDDYKYNTLLQDTQEIAKVNKVGIWSDEAQQDADVEDKDTNLEKETDKKKEESKNKKDKTIIEEFFDMLLETLVASINEIIDSILQKIEDML